jgi:hypothetical protein
MRQFPREIEADLLFRGVDIEDWHQGRMSSRRLLALIDALPDDSAYLRERRDGDWSEREYMWAVLVNEIKLLRAEQAAIHAGHDMKVNMFESPLARLEQELEQERVKQLRAHVLEQMHKGKQQ